MLPHSFAASAKARLAAAMQFSTLAAHRYPWDGLEAQFRAAGDVLPLVGYGSLLSLDSARRTVPRAVALGTELVVVAGGLRLFNYRMSEPALLRDEGGTPSYSSAALNVEETRRPEHLFNGRLYSVPPEEIDALRRREVGYDLCPLPYVPWEECFSQRGERSASSDPVTLPQDSRSGPGSKPPHRSVREDGPRAKSTAPDSGGRLGSSHDVPQPPCGPIGFAYVLSCRANGPYAESLIDPGLLPPAGYYAVCRDGARSISEAFLECYLATTHLGDGITTAAQWEARRRSP